MRGARAALWLAVAVTVAGPAAAQSTMPADPDATGLLPPVPSPMPAPLPSPAPGGAPDEARPDAAAQDGPGPATLYPGPGLPGAAIPADRPPPPERVVAGLSDDSVAITTSFEGSEILIYGAIRREIPVPPGDLDVIVTIEAPSQPLTIWRKARRMGIWVNSERVEVGAAPSYYAVATTAPLARILDPDWDNRYRISLPLALRAFEAPPEVRDTTAFTQALIRLRQQNGQYRLDESSVTLVDDTLFRADIRLPANLLEGDYKTRIFLMRGGAVIDVHRAAIVVRKVGLERFLYALAFQQPLAYGLMSLAVAVIAGWGASAAFLRLRRR